MWFSRSWVVIATVLLIVLVFSGGILGCGCTEERITSRLPANVSINGNTQSALLQDQIPFGSISTFSAYRATILDAGGSGAAPGGITWIGFASGYRWLFLALDTPVVQGDAISVQTLGPVGYSGVVDQGFFPAGERGLANMQFDAFRPATVTGSLTVLDTRPLKLRVDLTFGNTAADSTVHVAGDVEFNDVKVKIPCT